MKQQKWVFLEFCELLLDDKVSLKSASFSLLSLIILSLLLNSVSNVQHKTLVVRHPWVPEQPLPVVAWVPSLSPLPGGDGNRGGHVPVINPSPLPLDLH